MKTTAKLSVLVGLVLLALCLSLAACEQNPTIAEGQTTENGSTENGSTENGSTENATDFGYALNEAGDGYIVTGIGTLGGTELVIPATYKDLPVEEIAAEAFKGCTQLTSIELPENIHVGEFAFSGCTGLKQVVIPKGAKCRNGAFADCTGLESATLYSSIGERMFENCTGLKHLTYGADTHIVVTSDVLGQLSQKVTNWEDVPEGANAETVYEYDENGNVVYEGQDEFGQPIPKLLYIIVTQPLVIESVSGGILNSRSGLMGLPMLTLAENYTVEGEHYLIDGVLIGESNHTYEDVDPANDNPYGVLWVPLQLETLNLTELASYFQGHQLRSLVRFSAYPMVKTIYAPVECDLRDLTLSESVTDIYYSGTILTWIENVNRYFGDSCIVHCSDGDISKEQSEALRCTASVDDYRFLYSLNISFLSDLELVVEYKTAYDALLAIKTVEEYESYAEYVQAAKGTEEYELYQEYIAYRTAKARYTTTKNRRLNDLLHMYISCERIVQSNVDATAELEKFINVHLPVLEHTFGGTVEYELGKEDDLSAIINMDQLPHQLRNYISFYIDFSAPNFPKTPAEVKALYDQAVAAMIEPGYITQEELDERINGINLNGV